jgi:hypothetical protein
LKNLSTTIFNSQQLFLIIKDYLLNKQYFLLGDSIILKGEWKDWTEKDKQQVILEILKKSKE